MGRPRTRSQRDGFTASGSGGRFNDEYAAQDVPRFVPKHRVPPYMDPRVRRKQKGPQGGDE